MGESNEVKRFNMTFEDVRSGARTEEDATVFWATIANWENPVDKNGKEDDPVAREILMRTGEMLGTVSFGQLYQTFAKELSSTDALERTVMVFDREKNKPNKSLKN